MGTCTSSSSQKHLTPIAASSGTATPKPPNNEQVGINQIRINCEQFNFAGNFTIVQRSLNATDHERKTNLDHDIDQALIHTLGVFQKNESTLHEMKITKNTIATSTNINYKYDYNYNLNTKSLRRGISRHANGDLTILRMGKDKSGDDDNIRIRNATATLLYKQSTNEMIVIDVSGPSPVAGYYNYSYSGKSSYYNCLDISNDRWLINDHDDQVNQYYGARVNNNNNHPRDVFMLENYYKSSTRYTYGTIPQEHKVRTLFIGEIILIIAVGERIYFYDLSNSKKPHLIEKPVSLLQLMNQFNVRLNLGSNNDSNLTSNWKWNGGWSTQLQTMMEKFDVDALCLIHSTLEGQGQGQREGKRRGLHFFSFLLFGGCETTVTDTILQVNCECTVPSLESIQSDVFIARGVHPIIAITVVSLVSINIKPSISIMSQKNITNTMSYNYNNCKGINIGNQGIKINNYSYSGDSNNMLDTRTTNTQIQFDKYNFVCCNQCVYNVINDRFIIIVGIIFNGNRFITQFKIINVDEGIMTMIEKELKGNINLRSLHYCNDGKMIVRILDVMLEFDCLFVFTSNFWFTIELKELVNNYDGYTLGKDRRTRLSWKIERVIWIGYLKNGLENTKCNSDQSRDDKDDINDIDDNGTDDEEMDDSGQSMRCMFPYIGKDAVRLILTFLR